MKVVGFDIGGTKIEASVFEFVDKPVAGAKLLPLDRGNVYMAVRATIRRPTEREKGFDYVLNKMGILLEDVLKEAKVKPNELTGIGLAQPGTIHPLSGVMLNGNSQIFVGKSLALSLKEKTGISCPIKSANDANCFALAEVLCGAGVDFKNETGVPTDKQIGVGIILGTGVGAGVVFNGKMFEGRRGAAAEAGHTLLITDGKKCYCGRTGCAELYLSGTGLEASYFDKFNVSKGGKDIFADYALGESRADQLVINYRSHLVKFLANLFNLFDPDYFVLGGGVSLQPAVYEGLERDLLKEVFVKNSGIKVYQNRKGDSAGAFGAALLFLE